MDRVEDSRLREHLRKPLLVVSEAYIGNSSELSPARVDVGVLENGVHDSLLIMGPSLIVKPNQETPPEYRVYSILGVQYLVRNHYSQTPVPLPNSVIYSFPSDAEGMQTIRRIQKGLLVKAIN